MDAQGESARYRESASDSWRSVVVQWASASDGDIGFVEAVNGEQDVRSIVVRVQLGTAAGRVPRVAVGGVFEITAGNSEVMAWPVERVLSIEDGYARALCTRKVLKSMAGRTIGQR